MNQPALSTRPLLPRFNDVVRAARKLLGSYVGCNRQTGLARVGHREVSALAAALGEVAE